MERGREGGEWGGGREGEGEGKVGWEAVRVGRRGGRKGWRREREGREGEKEREREGGSGRGWEGGREGGGEREEGRGEREMEEGTEKMERLTLLKHQALLGVDSQSARFIMCTSETSTYRLHSFHSWGPILFLIRITLHGSSRTPYNDHISSLSAWTLSVC